MTVENLMNNLTNWWKADMRRARAAYKLSRIERFDDELTVDFQNIASLYYAKARRIYGLEERDYDEC